MNLVPFGEFVPPLLRLRQPDHAGGWRLPAREACGRFPSRRGAGLGAFICYEAVFPHFVRRFAAGGAEVLVNISNDGYFGHSAAREQHLNMVRMRAAENRRWILRSTNDGITATIDPAGRIIDRLAPDQQAVLSTRYSYIRDADAVHTLRRLVRAGVRDRGGGRMYTTQVKRTMLTRRAFVGSMAAVPLIAQDQDWVALFNGRNLEGWRAAGKPNSWKVVDGQLAADGPLSHLFYAGPVRGADFKNFELEVEALARPTANSGVYFHTAYQERAFHEGLRGPDQQQQSARGKKTGSLYNLRNVYKQFVRDDEWFKLTVAVRGKNVQVRLNGMLLVDYVEPAPPVHSAEHGEGANAGTRHVRAAMP